MTPPSETGRGNNRPADGSRWLFLLGTTRSFTAFPGRRWPKPLTI